MNSVIINFFVTLFRKIYRLFSESKFYNLFKNIDLFFCKAIKNSCVFSVFSSEDNFDNAYRIRVSEPISSVIEKVRVKLKFIVDLINKSTLNKFINNFVTGFFDAPLRKVGFLLINTSIFSVLRYLVVQKNSIMLSVSLVLVIIALLMIMIKLSIRELVSNSFVFGKLFKNTENKQIECYNNLTYIISGIILGVLVLFTGLIPTALSVFFFVFIYLIFNYSFYAVVFVPFMLPFFPTMVLVALSLLMLGMVAVKSFVEKNEINDNCTVMNFAIAMYLVTLVFGTVFSYTPVSSLKITMVYVSFILFYFAILKTIKTLRQFIQLVYALVIASVPVSVYGIIQRIFGFDGQSTWHDENMFEDISGRVVSFFENPNVFGEYLIWFVIISLSAFFIGKTKISKTVFALAFVTSCASMVFTYSRGCWIGVVVALAIYLFLTNRKVFWTFVFCGFISLFFLPDSIISRIASVGDMADTSTSYRVYIWKGTFEMLKDYWVTGIGLGSDAFNEIYPLYAYAAIRAPHPHNLYLLIFSETGIIGCITFLFVIFVYYKNMVKSYVYSKKKELKNLSATFLSAMTGYLIQGLFDNVWYNYRIYFLFWIFVAMSTVLYLRSTEELRK